MELMEQLYIERYLKQNPNELSLVQQIKLRDELRQSDSKKTASDQYVDFYAWMKKRPSREEAFAGYLYPKLLPFVNGKILEVGCGPRALLSRRLIESGYNMTAIDPKLEITNETFRPEVFSLDYDINQYACVVALEPCEAAELIIRLCVQMGVPFFVVPCGTPHKRMDNRESENFVDWWTYLKKIDSSIKMSAVNLVPGFMSVVLTNV